MKRKFTLRWKQQTKMLTRAVLMTLTAGSIITGAAFAEEQTATEFGRAITGGTDQLYVDSGVKQADGTYKFTKDSTITIGDAILGETYPVNTDGGNKVIVDATGKKLTLVSKGKGLRVGIQTALKNNKKIDITADKLIVKAENTEGMSRAYGIWFAGLNNTLDVHGDAEITANGNDWSYGVLTGRTAKINIEGLKASVSKEAEQSAALKGTGKSILSVNVKDGTVGSKSVQLDGEVVTKYSFEEDDEGTQTADGPSTINLALTTADSYWKGLGAYEYKDENEWDTITKEDHGNLNLWLQNGAAWTNEKYGKTNYAGFKGSYVTALTGGSDAGHAGVIVQKDANPITVDNYSGYTTLIYAHGGDGTTAANYTAGNTVVKKATAGSSITVLTDKSGIAIDNEGKIYEALNALAGKLWYEEAKAGGTNLAGKAKIAEGLTASSAAVKLEDITFKKEDGQGTVVKPQPQQAELSPITGDKAKDAYYVEKGILEDEGIYNFKEDTELKLTDGRSVVVSEKAVAINAAGKTLTFVSEGEKGLMTLTQQSDGPLQIAAKKISSERCKYRWHRLWYVNCGCE